MDVSDKLILVDIAEPIQSGSISVSHTIVGRTFPPQQQILLYSASEWENFINEWVHSQRNLYKKVRRYTGSGDMGIDIAGMYDNNELLGSWDNFQCKHYDSALKPSQISIEIGKILWYSFKKEYVAPKNYYLISPKGCTPSLSKLLSNSVELKAYVYDNWINQCESKIAQNKNIELTGDFKNYVDTFDFSIFKYRTALEIIDEHRLTKWFTGRFGGGLPIRPAVSQPPEQIHTEESRYISQLFEVYSDLKSSTIKDYTSLESFTDLKEHFTRQREVFYHAESLRNFARDTVPEGTFQELQNEILSGVIEIESTEHSTAFNKLNAVLIQASKLQLTSNALITVLKTQDRKGICHQLANVDKLKWKK